MHDCIVLLHSYWKDYNPGPLKEVSGIMEVYVERKYFCVSFVRHSPNGEDRADRLSIPP